MTRLKVGRNHALIVILLRLPLGVKRLALALMIMVDGVGFDGASRPLVMEK